MSNGWFDVPEKVFEQVEAVSLAAFSGLADVAHINDMEVDEACNRQRLARLWSVQANTLIKPVLGFDCPAPCTALQAERP